MTNTTDSSLKRATFRTALFILICLILIYAKTILIPLAWALLISLASTKFVTRIKEKTKLPSSLIIMLYILFIFLVLGVILVFFTLELEVLLADMEQIQVKLSMVMHHLSIHIRGLGINIPDHYDPEYFKNIIKEHNSAILALISGIGTNLWNILLTIFYIFFLLYYKDLLVQFAQSKFNDRAKMLHFNKLVLKIIDISHDYIAGMFILGLIITVLSYIFFVILSIKAAFFFAVFFGVLSLIPVVGVPIGMVVIAVFTLLTKDSAMTAVYVAGVLFVLNFVQDNIFRPLLMGTKLSVNSFAVFFFVILGGFVWGVSGMILFIPLASILKVILENSENGSPYSIFLSEMPVVKKSVKRRSLFKKNKLNNQEVDETDAE